jgi:hypothetical protein
MRPHEVLALEDPPEGEVRLVQLLDWSVDRVEPL